MFYSHEKVTEKKKKHEEEKQRGDHGICLAFLSYIVKKDWAENY